MSKINIVDEKFINKLNKPVVVLDLAYSSMFSLNKIKEALPYASVSFLLLFSFAKYNQDDMTWEN